MSTMISFLTDFGLSDTSVGQCKGVIAAIAAKAVVIDVSHAVPHYDVAAGAWMLRQAVPHFPPCVHLAVVDPGVGTERRSIAIECARGDILVGPDNGLLLDAATVLGGISSVTNLTEGKFHHHPVSSTFHARDIFAPAAAHIVHGVTVHMLGPSLDPEHLVRLPTPASTFVDGALHTQVAYINEYGALALFATGALFEPLKSTEQLVATIGDQSITVRHVRTFGQAAKGERILFIDSYGQLSLAVNQGDLAHELGLPRTARPEIVLRRA